MTYVRNVSIKTQDSFSIDAFGRWRVSNPTTLFDSKNIFNDSDIADTSENQPLIYDNQETSGSGTSTLYLNNKSSQRISVDALVHGTRVRQSKQSFNYQPGKSQLILLTFNFNSLDSGIKKRAGYFNENNGLFLESDGSDIKLTRRTYTSGTPVDNSVESSSWNIDPMDGTGPSGVTLDFTKTQILFCDFEWLGVGRVRMGFVVDGLIYYAHEFLNTNNLTEVYMTIPNLPIRWEISNDGTGSSSHLDTICASVMSEGGVNDLGIVRSYLSSKVDANATNSNYAILSMRLKSNYIGSVVNILDISFLESTGNCDIAWSLILNPTVAGSLSYTDVTNSAIQIANGATANTVTGGYIINSGFFNSGSGNVGGNLTASIKNALALGSTISGTADRLVLCAKPIGSTTNADVFGSVTWRELI